MSIHKRLQRCGSEISRLYQEGKSTVELASMFNCERGNINYLLKSIHIDRRPRPKYFEGNIEDYKDKIIQMFTIENISINKISTIVGIEQSYLNTILQKWGYDTSKHSKKRNDELVNHSTEISEMYRNGISIPKIAKKFNCATTSLSQLLRKEKVEIRPLNTYDVNIDYFKNIDNENKAYILGWIYSNGNIMKDRWRISIQEEDGYILEWIKNEIQYNGPLYHKKAPKNHDNWKNQIEINIARKEMVDSLRPLGVHENKSTTLQFPSFEIIPKNLFNHFLRGYFDGDGSFNNKKYPSISIAGSNYFCDGLLIFLNNIYIYPNIYCYNTYKKICSGNKSCVLKFGHLLYDNATIYLKRKKDIFDSYTEKGVYPSVT